MSALVVDTSSWNDYFASGFRSDVIDDALNEGRVVLPPVVAAELTSGPLGRRELSQLKTLLSDLPRTPQGGSMAHFNLVNSLYHERSLYMPNHHEEVSKPILSDKDLTPAYSDAPENVLSDIQYAQNSLAA